MAYCRSGGKPDDIPAVPRAAYGSEWKGMGDWLGTGTRAPSDREYRPFVAAREFVHSLGFRTQAEWLTYCKSGNTPDDVPSRPDWVYRAEWVSMGDWLGTGTVAPQRRTYQPFDIARTFVRSLRLEDEAAWRAFCKSGRKPSVRHPERSPSG